MSYLLLGCYRGGVRSQGHLGDQTDKGATRGYLEYRQQVGLGLSTNVRDIPRDSRA